MAEEALKAFGSIRVRGTQEEMKEICTWAEESGLRFSSRDLYDRWSTERIWSFEFNHGEDFFVFYMRWENMICGYRVCKND
jgi:hypothetical protein